MSREEKYRKAEQKVARMKKFYKHLSTWMFTSIFLMIFFFMLRMPPFVALIVVGGWGIAIAAEAIEVFGFPGIGDDWEQRKIEEELRKMDKHHHEDHTDELELTDQPEKLKEERKDWKDSDLV